MPITVSPDDPWSCIQAAYLSVYGATLPIRQEATQALYLHCLIPLAKRVEARRLGRRYPSFIDAAANHVWTKLKEGAFDWRRGEFSGWAYRVMDRVALDYLRGAAGDHDIDQAPAPPPPPPDGEAVISRFRAMFAEIQTLISSVRTRPEWKRRSVNYFAVFLLEMRRAVAARLRYRKMIPGLAMLMGMGNDPDSLVIATLLPWTKDDERLTIARGIPPLKDIWTTFSLLIDTPPHDLEVAAFCHCVTLPGGRCITEARWYQWKARMIEIARPMFEPEDWQRLFDGWFDQQRGR